MEPALAYLHYLSIIAVGACLAAEFYLCTPELQPPYVRILARVDLTYLIAAIAVLATGFARLFASPKGMPFYLQNPVFYIKLALFVAVGLVSIAPTLLFLRWQRALKSGKERILNGRDIVSARRYIVLELALFAFIPLAAVLMARGIGIQH